MHEKQLERDEILAVEVYGFFFFFGQNKFVHDPIVFLGDGYQLCINLRTFFYIKNSETHNTMKLRT